MTTAVQVSARSVLGIAVRSDADARRVVEEVAPEALSGPHSVILETLTQMVEQGEPVAPGTVMSRILAGKSHTTQQTLNELADVIGDQDVSLTLGWHLKVLAEHTTRIRLQAVADTARQMAEGEEIADQGLLRERLERAGHVRTAALPTIADMLDLYLPQMDEPADTSCLSTGIADLDRLLNGGMRPGQLLVVGARPGVGKSVLLLALARHAALRCDTRVLMASMEMDRSEVFWRYVAAETRTDLTYLIGRTVDEADKERVYRKFDRMNRGHLHINDAGSQSIRDIGKSVRAHKPGLIVVDYLQQLAPADPRQPRQEQVSAMSRQLKIMAKDAGCPVLVAAQLNRGQTQRTDPRPRMSDLRESGSIEADADVVALLHRDPEDNTFGTTAELIVAKNRSGPLGVVDLNFEGHYANLSGAYRP